MRSLLQHVVKSDLWRLAIASTLLAILDLLGVAVIFPYLSIVAADSPDSVHAYAAAAYRLLGSGSHTEFVVTVSLILMVFFGIKFALGYALNRMRAQAYVNVTIRLSDDLLRLLLNADYGHLVNKSVSEMTGIIISQTVHATICLDSVITIATESLFFLFILIAIIAFDAKLAFVLIAALILLSILLYFGILKSITRLGSAQSEVHLRQYSFLFSVVGAIKDIKILGLEASIEKEHRLLNSRYAQAMTSFQVYQTQPRAILESFVMIGLLGACIFMLLSSVDIKSTLPFLGFLAVSSLRLVPAYSRVVGSYGSFNYYKPSLSLICGLFEDLSQRQVIPARETLEFRKSLEIQNLNFSHGDKPVLVDVSLVIPKGSSVGIVGLSGSGKTTLLDVIAGLRQAAAGRFLMDDRPFDPFRSDALRRLLGYVPQNVTLVDDTIAFNIAFDIEPDHDRLQRAASVARIKEFIESLPEGFQTLVGENGVRVSGGQKQRIGIARALYRDPEILIFDEATSSLDNVTERELNEEIEMLSGAKTLVIVAHRLSTVVHCDVIHVFDEGRIVGSGTHLQLLQSCRAYQSLYGAQSEAVPKPVREPVLHHLHDNPPDS
ncbi:MAG: ABC transporter ATP-binding protein [Nitrospira sp.]|nr:MAG: ABC transporter ATP-binding protein [Nitrospira sp.]